MSEGIKGWKLVPVANMYPSDLKRFAEEETFAHAYSVAVGSPSEESVPLYSAEQLATLQAKLERATHERDLYFAGRNEARQDRDLLQAKLEQAEKDKAGLVDAINNCLNWANGREDEWGDRAINAYGFLYSAIAKYEEKK